MKCIHVQRSQKTKKQLIPKAHMRLIDAFYKIKIKWQEYWKFAGTAPELPKLAIHSDEKSMENQF